MHEELLRNIEEIEDSGARILEEIASISTRISTLVLSQEQWKLINEVDGGARIHIMALQCHITAQFFANKLNDQGSAELETIKDVLVRFRNTYSEVTEQSQSATIKFSQPTND